MLHYHGRRKALIKYQNRHIYPAELERIAHETYPGSLGAACAVGLQDPLAQELPALALVLAPGVEMTEAEVEEKINGKVEDYKRLRGGVHFLEELPASAQGKVKRREVVDIITKKMGKH